MNYFKRLLNALEKIADNSTDEKYRKFLDKFTSGEAMRQQAEWQSYFSNRTQLRQWIATYRVAKAKAIEDLDKTDIHHIEFMEQYEKDGILKSYNLSLNN